MNLYDSNEYRASKQWPYAITAGCVVYRFNNDLVEVLLLKRNAGHINGPSATIETYNLPKGHVAINEPLEVAAKRETEEETGAEVELQTYLGSMQFDFMHPRHHIQNQKVVHYFAALWKADISQMDQEHDQREWISLQNAEELLAKPEARRCEDELIRRLKSYLEIANAA